jgi:hypothetical protein
MVFYFLYSQKVSAVYMKRALAGSVSPYSSSMQRFAHLQEV